MALVLAGFSALGGCAAPGRPVDGMTALNEAARAAYREARAEALARVDPILVAGPASLVLIHGGVRSTAQGLPPDYTELKMVSHLALGLHALLFGQEGALSPERLPRLRDFRARVVGLSTSLERRGLSPGRLTLQRGLVAASLAFVDGVLGRGALAAGELGRFERTVTPSLLASAEDATRAQLDWTHAQVSAWRRTLSPAAWRSLHVVVIGAHQPREGYVLMAYFQRLLGEPFEGRRIIYAEGLWQEDAALELLGTHVLDATIGEGFFGDPRRMHRDLLSDAAAAYLPTLLPEAGP